MGWEIERKFLVNGDSYKKSPFKHITQGYLGQDKNCTIRVRIIDNQGFLTVKGKNAGIKRSEFEYAIPQSEAVELLQLSLYRPIEKIRYLHNFKKHLFEVDVFQGENKGLILCEVELENEFEQFERPDFLGEEVSHDPRYYNSNLSLLPFAKW